MTRAAPDDTPRRALGYARRGWPVFPCRPGGKEPATAHGHLDATTDPDRIAWWWSRRPDANLAIATGAPGPDVLDVDQRGEAGNGLAAWRQLATSALTGGAIAVVATPGGGLHAYFPGTCQPSRRLPRHHLDFKARGGYVLAPPSRIGGKPYRLLAEPGPSGAVLDWGAVTRLLEPPRPDPTSHPAVTGADADRLVSWVTRLEEGNRNSGLFWAACRAIESGQVDILDDLAAAAATVGLPPIEITRTIASARRSARRHIATDRPLRADRAAGQR